MLVAASERCFSRSFSCNTSSSEKASLTFLALLKLRSIQNSSLEPQRQRKLVKYYVRREWHSRHGSVPNGR